MAGETWAQVKADHRIARRGRVALGIAVSPGQSGCGTSKIPRIGNRRTVRKTFGDGKVRRAATRLIRSTWINRDNGQIIACRAKGAVTVSKAGATWSSWTNQPNAQFYHGPGQSVRRVLARSKRAVSGQHEPQRLGSYFREWRLWESRIRNNCQAIR